MSASDAPDCLAPCLLVAMPQLQDPNFKRSVVLLVAHAEEGAMGFIVNRQLPAGVRDVLDGLDIDWAGPSDAALWSGGPVMPESGWVLFEHGKSTLPPESKEVLPGLYLTASLEALRMLAANPPKRFRLLLGYTGWGAGQLETELVDSAWLVVPLETDLIFEIPTNQVWTQAIRRLGIEPESIVPGHGIQ